MDSDKEYLASRDGIVRKANDLIQKSRFSLSTQQQKIILYLISKISLSDQDFKEYEFDIREFCKVCGLDDCSGKNYKLMKDAIKGIRDKSLWILLPDGRKSLISWIEKARIEDQSGKIQIRLDSDMKPFLIQLKKNYTQYELLWTLNFKSKYSIRLYELIKSVHYHELEPFVKEYSLEELRGLLDAEKYERYQHFKERVLIPAVNEINSFSDKKITFEPIKKGRSFIRIRFTVESKDTFETLRIRSEIEHEFGLDQCTLWDELQDKGLV